MKTKKRLVSVIVTSCVALCLCAALLAGSTFAWFTDTLVSSGNIIKAGNIDIDGTVYYEADSGTAEEGKVTVSVEDTSTTIYPIITKTAPAEGSSGNAIDDTGYYGYGEKTLTFDMGEGTGADLAMSGALVGGDGTLPVEPGESYARLIKLENTGTIDAVAKFRFYADGALGQYLWFDLIPVTYSDNDGSVTIAADSGYAFTPQDIDTFNGTGSDAEADAETGLYPHEYELKVKTEETEADTVWMVLLFGMITDADNSVAGLDVDLTMTIIATQTVGRGKNAESGVVADYPEWDGTNDLSWIPSNMSGQTHRYDHAGETYTIYTPQQLGGLAYYCNHNIYAFTDVTVKIGADIDLGNYEWTPIGLRHADTDEKGTSGDSTGSWHGFFGDFDGDGHTIYNLSVQEGHEHSSEYSDSNDETEWTADSTDAYVGLFGRQWGGKIENVTIHNASVRGTQCVGVLCGSAGSGETGSTFSGTPTDDEYVETDEYGDFHTLISNCHAEGLIRVEGNKQVGGLIGNATGIHLDGCSVEGISGSYLKDTYGTDDQDGKNVGGLVGFMGTNSASQYVVYPNGYDKSSSTSGTYTNKVIAEADVVPMTDCSVSGLEISGTRRVGGLIGYAQCPMDLTDCEVKNCDIKLSYDGNVTIGENGNLREGILFVGAFIGLYQMKTTVDTCTTENVSVSYFEAWAAGMKAYDETATEEIYKYRGETVDPTGEPQSTIYTDGLFGGAVETEGMTGHYSTGCEEIAQAEGWTMSADNCPVTLILLDITKYT